MDSAQGKKIYYGIVLDNAQLRQDAEQSKNIFRGIGDASAAEASRIDNAYKSVSGTLMKLGAALSAVELAKGLYNFADRFERSMAEVTTISETVTNDLGKFKREIIEMSTEIPVPADEAAKALYQIVSAGHDGAAGLEVLRVSAKAAVGGVTETVTAADAITSILNAYKKGAGEAENISDQLFTTVRLGKTTMGELGHSISQAIPIAASFGIASEQVLAAIATLTKSGTPTAQAVTQVRAAIKAASEQLGDGYFKTHTFQQGLQEIANKAGGSEAKLRALVPEIEGMNGILGLTGINAKTAASDLEELSNSAGATESAFQKMANETSSQLTILKNNVLAEFSELGESMVDNVGKVAAALNEAFDTGKIDKLLSVLGSLIAMYGTYKAALIGIEALQKSTQAVKYTEEAAGLYKLLSAEQQAKISKLELAKTSEAYSKAVKAEVVAEMERQTKLAVATNADITAARVRLEAAREEKTIIAEKVAVREAELAAAVASGNAKKIEAAQTSLSTAQEQLNTASVTVNSAAREVSSKRAVLDTAIRKANTLEIGMNTAAQTANATATGFLTVAKTRLTAVAAKLNAVIMANPATIAAAGIAALAYEVYKLATYESEAEKAQKRYNEAQAEFEKTSTSEIAALNIMFSRLNKAKEGTDEYRAAKEAIQRKYGDYLSKMDDEVRLLKDTASAQKELTAAILETARARAREKFIQQESDAASEKQVTALRQIREKLIKEKGEEVGKAIYEQIKSMLVAYQNDPQDRDGSKYSKYVRLLRENGLEKDIGYGRLFSSAYVDYVSSVQELLKAQQEAESYFEAPQTGEASTEPVGSTTKLKTYAEQVKETAETIKRLRSELADLRAGKGEFPDFAAAITAKEKELKEAQDKFNSLMGVDPKQMKKRDDEAVKAFERYEQIVHTANERFASDEIQFQRKKIEDKIALIEFDRQQTIAAIEQMKEEAKKAWTDSGKDAGSFDGTIFQNLIDAANLHAAFDTDNVISTQKKKEEEELDALLRQFRTYEQQRTDIVAEYNDKIAQLREAGENEAAEVAEKRRNEALINLSQSMMEESDLWVKLFEDASKKSVSQIEHIISETESLLDYLQGKDGAEIPLGFTDDQLKSLKGSPEAIAKIQGAIKRLKGEIGNKSPFKQFSNDIDDAIEQIKDGGRDNIGAGIMNIGKAVTTITPHVKQFGEELSTILGDSGISENIDILTGTLTGLGTAAVGVGQIMTGDILGGISSVVSGIASIFSMANAAAERHREALAAVMNAKIAQQREYNLLLLEQNLLYEKGITIFGSDEYGKAMNAIEVYKKAYADLREAMAGTDAQKKAQRRRSYFLSIFGIKDAQSTLKQIYAGLADIEIVTGHKKTGLFGWGKGKDLYSSVLDVYDDLIDKEGQLNLERAKSILATRKMSEEDKNALQNMIYLYEQYEAAMQAARDYLSGIFGELGNTMSDALVDAFKNGTDAAEAFSKSVSEMLENLAQQMIYSVTLAPIMEKAQDKMLEVMKNGDLSDDDKFAQWAEILSNLTDEALSQQENADYLMKLYQDMAAEKGIDIFQPDAEREASSKGIATTSQESVDKLSGRATAIQGHTLDIREAVNSIAASREQDLSRIEVNTDRLQTIDANVLGIREGTNLLVAHSARMLEHLAGIETNTDRLHAMGADIADMRSGLASMRRSVDDIVLKGLKLK